MHTQLEQLVKICERAEARIKRKLLAARAYESECRRSADAADTRLAALRRDLHRVNRQVVAAVGLALHRFQATQQYLSGLQENLEIVRGDVRRTHDALAIAEYERSQLPPRLLAASVKLENARLREVQWCCQRDAINAAQQEEYSIESWFLRQH